MNEKSPFESKDWVVKWFTAAALDAHVETGSSEIPEEVLKELMIKSGIKSMERAKELEMAARKFVDAALSILEQGAEAFGEGDING